MKKLLAILLVLTMVFSFAACGNKEDVSSDVGTSSSITSIEGDKTSSETTNNESTGAATTSDATSGSSSEQNTSKPTTSTPPSTSKPTETHTHTWGNWSIETEALVGKDGIEKRTCSGCKETETRKKTSGAVYNSFFDEGITHIMFALHENRISTPICIEGLKSYVTGCWYFTPDTNALEFLSARFELTPTLKEEIKNNTFSSEEYRSCGNCTISYVHNGGNKYTVYYHLLDWYDEELGKCKVELEYNLINGKPNKYLSIEEVDSFPENLKWEIC